MSCLRHKWKPWHDDAICVRCGVTHEHVHAEKYRRILKGAEQEQWSAARAARAAKIKPMQSGYSESLDPLAAGYDAAGCGVPREWCPFSTGERRVLWHEGYDYFFEAAKKRESPRAIR